MSSPYLPYNVPHVLVVIVIDILVPSYDTIGVQFNAHQPTSAATCHRQFPNLEIRRAGGAIPSDSTDEKRRSMARLTDCSPR